jgi:uncharacterized protein (DUF302 family)
MKVAVMTTDRYRRTRHGMTRIDIWTGMPFEDFRTEFEKAVPAIDLAAVTDIAETGGSWDDVRAAAAANAPNELMIYATVDARPLLAPAGHRTKAVEYLVGNHVIAETMFRHHPLALLYAPLRVLVHEDRDGNAVFSMDQPSAAFSSLGIDEISAVGQSLDRKVDALLRVIGVDPGDAFVAPS